MGLKQGSCNTEIILDYPGGPSAIIRVLIRRQKGQSQRERVTEDATLLALKMQEGLWAKEHRQPLDTGKRKKSDSPLDPPEGTQPCQPLVLGLPTLRTAR